MRAGARPAGGRGGTASRVTARGGGRAPRELGGASRGPKRATADNPRGLSGGATLTRDRGAERTVAVPGTRNAATAISWLEQLCVPRDGRDARGATRAPVTARATSRRGFWPASKAPRWRASFDRAGARALWRRPPLSRARGDAAGARGATVEVVLAPRVTDRVASRESRGAASERARRVLGRRVAGARGVPARSGAGLARLPGRDGRHWG